MCVFVRACVCARLSLLAPHLDQLAGVELAHNQPEAGGRGEARPRVGDECHLQLGGGGEGGAGLEERSRRSPRNVSETQRPHPLQVAKALELVHVSEEGLAEARRGKHIHPQLGSASHL